MSRKGIIFLGLLLLIVIIVGLVIIGGKEPAIGPDGEIIEDDGGFFVNLFPFGDGGSPNANSDDFVDPDETLNTGPLASEQGVAAVLQQLTNVPVAGYVSSTTDTGLFVRYVEKQTGNIYDIHLDRLAKKRVTNRTIPQVQEAIWNRKADQVLLRVTDENNILRNSIGSIVVNEESTATSVFGLEISSFIDSVDNAVSADFSDDFLYTNIHNNGISAFTHDFNEEEIQVFTSPHTDWEIDWISPKTAVATTRSANQYLGYAYSIDLDTGLFTKIIEKQGLTTRVSPNKRSMLYSEVTDGALKTKVLALDSGTDRPTDIGTLPEKCVWDRVRSEIAYCAIPERLSLGLPEAWYKGQVSFNDALWEIDTLSGNNRILVNPSNLSTNIDAYAMRTTPTNEYIFFINKKDGSLWSLRLSARN